MKARKKPGITLASKGDDFVLRRTDASGKTTSLTLSKDDILTLSQAIPSLRGHVLAGQSPGGGAISAVAMTEVVQLELNHDVHKSEIHLTMIDRHGARVGFALPPAVARPLADRLPARVDLIEAAATTRTRQ
jgi:hypothetical protein